MSVSCPLNEPSKGTGFCAAAGTGSAAVRIIAAIGSRYWISLWFSYAYLLLTVQAKSDGKSGTFIIFFAKGPKGLSDGRILREITNLLKAWSGGDPAALERLAEQVYPALRLMARRYMKNERPGQHLQPLALVHEVYLRLVDVAQGRMARARTVLSLGGADDAPHPGRGGARRASQKRGGMAPPNWTSMRQPFLSPRRTGQSWLSTRP